MKIFCIGCHKTGTTSIGKTLELLGFNLAPQRKGEELIYDFYNKKYDKIFNYIENYEVFQDTPYNLINFYEIIYEKFPNSYFILTIRNNGNEWYNSLIKFHRKLFYKNKKITCDLVKKTIYIKQNYLYDFIKKIFKTDDNDLYNKEKLMKYYENYNCNVINFFKNKKNFLKINLLNKEDFLKLLIFLKINNSKIDNFLHLNKT